MTSPSWLITGGCGFIGTNLIRRLLHENPSVSLRVLDNLSVVPNSLPPTVELIKGDVRDAKTCVEASHGVSVIIHLAAQSGVAPSVADPKTDFDINVQGTFNMLEAARINGVKKFVFASSGAPLGEVEPPIHEEKVCKPISPYGAGKLAGEAYLKAYHHSFGLETVALRFSNVYGPGSAHKNSVVAKFIRQALSLNPFVIYGDGSQTRDLIYVEDLVQAICLAVHSSAGGEIFQIASGREVSVLELATNLQKILQTKFGRSPALRHEDMRIGDVKKSWADISKARRVLGFDPKTDLESGLEKTLEYFIAATKRIPS